MYYKTASSGRWLNKLFRINDCVEILFRVYLLNSYEFRTSKTPLSTELGRCLKPLLDFQIVCLNNYVLYLLLLKLLEFIQIN